MAPGRVAAVGLALAGLLAPAAAACAKDEHVVSGACVACPVGSVNDAGDVEAGVCAAGAWGGDVTAGTDEASCEGLGSCDDSDYTDKESCEGKGSCSPITEITIDTGEGYETLALSTQALCLGATSGVAGEDNPTSAAGSCSKETTPTTTTEYDCNNLGSCDTCQQGQSFPDCPHPSNTLETDCSGTWTAAPGTWTPRSWTADPGTWTGPEWTAASDTACDWDGEFCGIPTYHARRCAAIPGSGTCSELSLTTRTACLEAGSCSDVQYTTKTECEQAAHGGSSISWTSDGNTWDWKTNSDLCNAENTAFLAATGSCGGGEGCSGLSTETTCETADCTWTGPSDSEASAACTGAGDCEYTSDCYADAATSENCDVTETCDLSPACVYSDSANRAGCPAGCTDEGGVCSGTADRAASQNACELLGTCSISTHETAAACTTGGGAWTTGQWTSTTCTLTQATPWSSGSCAVDMVDASCTEAQGESDDGTGTACALNEEATACAVSHGQRCLYTPAGPGGGTCTYVAPVAQGDKVACSAGTTFELPKWENGEGSHYGKADGDDKTCQACPASTTSTGRKCTCSLACAF